VRLPRNAIIAEEKLVQYLLRRHERGDKSAFLAEAGYTVAEAAQLAHDLRTHILSLEAEELESNQFGQYYEICGLLVGPNGKALAVRTIWMTEHLSGGTKFITLIPNKRRTR